MAHFAEIDEHNIVLRVIVVSNSELLVNNVENEEKGINFCKSLFGENTRWIQTSYNSNFRGIYAGKNCIYIPEIDKFISDKPYESWTLDSNYVWQPPIAKPTDASKDAVWDEVNQYWLDYDENNNLIQI